MRIVKRGEYFYLQHSFREEGKVVTRERYLGKKIPENIDELKQESREEWQRTLYAKLEKIRDKFQKEWGRCHESAKLKEKTEVAIAFTYNTNAIEGSKITLEETRDIVVDNVSPKRPLKDVRETEAHFKVFLEMLDKRDKISRDLLLRWHSDIFFETKGDMAGKYRDFLVRVGSYAAPDWQDVEGLMDQLVEFINNAGAGMNPVELAARAHYRFEKIHPFGDGNGRIGRLLMNHLLWHEGYPMLIIEYAKRMSYYKALERDEDGFLNYFLRRYLAVHGTRYVL